MHSVIQPAYITSGALVGLLVGLTGVGGGVFLTPMLLAFGWASPRRTAMLSPPFILGNSILGLAGVLLGGQRLAPSATLYAIAALAACRTELCD